MKKIKSFKLYHLRWAVLCLLLVFVILPRCINGIGECYAIYIYPVVSAALSGVASVLPFSLTETTVILVVIWLLAFPFYAAKRKKGWEYIAVREVELVLWVYVWFYLGWGMNYFRDSFYRRMEVPVAQYDESRFKVFIAGYADSINHAYTMKSDLSKLEVEKEVKRIYYALPEAWGLTRPLSFQHPKRSLVNALYSKVGVLGYMGPFFAESHVNHDLLPMQYPFTYAHELSHLLGVSSEAEANFWAYQVCTHSTQPYIKYSGYFELFAHVVNNAYALLSEEDFREWIKTIRPEIIAERKKQSDYWEALYSPTIGALQNTIYDFYLKGNRIASGRKNYGQVIALILSLPDDWTLCQ